MSSPVNSASNRPRSPATKPTASSTSETLTPSEIESLRQRKREIIAYVQKAFADLKALQREDS